MFTRLITIAISLAAMATVANAQPAARGMAACRTDTATFCGGIEAGGGKRIACLMANQDKLSAACSAAIQQRTAQAPVGGPTPAQAAPQGAPQAAPGSNVAPPAVSAPGASAAAPPAVTGQGVAPGKGRGGPLAACRADVRLLCASVPPGGGSKVRCLQDNQVKLSPACAQTLGDLKSTKQVARSACATDATALCPGLKGDARRACFTENQAKLSPECSAVIGKRAAR